MYYYPPSDCQTSCEDQVFFASVKRIAGKIVSEMAYSVSSGTLNTYNLGSTDLLIKPDVLYWSKSPVDNSGRE